MSQDKTKRKALPQKLRSLVWNKYIGKEYGIGKCWCCKSKDIEQMEFQCGHVDSVKEGGSNDINNLRPICAPCNLSMGSTNMFDFMNILGTNKADLPKDPTDDKAAKKFVCEFCNMNFIYASGLSRHKKKYCIKKKEKQKKEQEIQKNEQELKKTVRLEEKIKNIKNRQKEFDDRNQELKDQNKDLKDQNKELKDQNKELKDQNKDLKDRNKKLKDQNKKLLKQLEKQ